MFTFKKEKRETGLRAVGRPYPDTTIKYKKKNVGAIHAPTWNDMDCKWKIGITIASNCAPGWSWFFFKERFDSEQSARDYLKNNYKKIVSFNLHSFDEDE